MKYEKPEIIAQNTDAGSYAAGCPAKDRKDRYGASSCLDCERTA